jgi:predicted HicB family RNase H-like nuclease
MKSETLNLRVSPEFKRRLIEEAAKQRRSVTNYVEATLTAIWDREAQRPDRATTRAGPSKKL